MWWVGAGLFDVGLVAICILRVWVVGCSGGDC